MRPLDTIRPYPGNPRNNAAAVPKVAASLAAFGWRQPIVVDEAGVILAGHTRYLAAQSLGMATAPVHVATGLSPAQAKAYRLADNRTSEAATWDADLLGAELAGLAEMDLDLDLAATGFDATELAAHAGVGVGEVPLPHIAAGEKGEFEAMTFTLHREQADTVREALAAAQDAGPFVDSPNENRNGNALARLAEMALGVLR